MQPMRSASVVLALASLAGPAHADKMPACIHWSTLTVATSSGYNHVVTIDNGCDKPAACTISTDVAPDPIRATVAAKQRAELTTFRGSPASAFVARVECKLE